MAKKIFISYAHKQKEWVHNRLVPCLHAGGAEVLIDVDKFRVGEPLVGEMDTLQDQADKSLLVFTGDYLTRPNCQHEMNRAIARNAFIPLKLADCTLPAPIPDHLYADLRTDSDAKQWDNLLAACAADLGCAAPHWLAARDDIRRYLDRGDSVNLVVSGHPKWRELIWHLRQGLPAMQHINLEDGATELRHDLIRTILRVFGDLRPVQEKGALGLFSEFLKQRKNTMLAFLRFDMVLRRPYQVDFFANLRFHLEERNLTMLVESKSPFASLLPREHPMSSLSSIKQVELNGR